jgi:hypothetical protein
VVCVDLVARVVRMCCPYLQPGVVCGCMWCLWCVWGGLGEVCSLFRFIGWKWIWFPKLSACVAPTPNRDRVWCVWIWSLELSACVTLTPNRFVIPIPVGSGFGCQSIVRMYCSYPQPVRHSDSGQKWIIRDCRSRGMDIAQLKIA